MAKNRPDKTRCRRRDALNEPTLDGYLWLLGAKLQGLSVLPSYFSSNAILNQGGAAYGIGQLLDGLATNVAAIREQLARG